MASNRTFQQFLFNETPMLTLIQGKLSLTDEAKAARTTQGVTLTADEFGSAGNDISIAFTGGGTAGAEVVTVTDSAISVQVETRAKATLTTQGLVLTAVDYGPDGNDITIEFVGGGTAPAVGISVAGTDIQVTIEDGVSTRAQVLAALQGDAGVTALVTVTGPGVATMTTGGPTPLAGGAGSSITQVVAAIEGDTAAAALVDATGSGATVLAVASPLFLTGGTDGVSSTGLLGVSSAVQTDVGEITLTLDSEYNAWVAGELSLMKATAQDLIPQFVSEDVAATKEVVIHLLTGATPTDPDDDCTLFVSMWLRNSSVAQ